VGKPTCHGDAEKAPCAFPFTYDGTTYKECTTVNHEHTWCYTTNPGKWGNCDCEEEKACGMGQTTKTRKILQEAKHGGEPCTGSLSVVSTCGSECPAPPNAAGCEWGEWNLWGACDKCGGQRKRVRQIKKMPEAGGDPCQPGAAMETEKCPRECHAEEFCEWSAWATDQPCSVECGAGFEMKSRHLQPKPDGRRLSPLEKFNASGAEVKEPGLDTVAVNSEASCHGRQVERFACKMKSCDVNCHPVNCVENSWSDWSSADCTGLCERHREILTPNNECGQPCNSSLVTTKRCKTTCHKEPTDCVFGEWNEWMAMSEKPEDSVCEGAENTKVRNRYPSVASNGGVPCEGLEKQVTACPETPKEDCEVTEWTKWGQCSTTCGPGQRVRTRKFVNFERNCGESCTEDLEETEPCEETTCSESIDCEWDSWALWSACTCTCGGGQKTRDRVIKISPKGEGMLCDPETRTEISPCNTMSCTVTVCIDGEWGPWGDYGACSAACGGGIQWKFRKIKTEATDCGIPALGNDKDVRSCNTGACGEDKDCLLSEWTHWSDCSCTKDGVKRRVRSIKQYGQGDGGFCHGDLKQITGCNTCEDLGTCDKEQPKQDCVLGAWEKGKCTATCGSGHTMSTRIVVTQPSNGGAPCDAKLEKITPCNEEDCETVTVKGCEWDQWLSWGACDKCGGQRKRNRQIKHMPEKGGSPCEIGASEEIEKCPRHCHTEYWCEWGEWSISNCSVACGHGVAKKSRQLVATPVTTASQLAAVYRAMDKDDVLHQQSNRVRDVWAAFCGGGLMSAVGFALIARTSRSRVSNSDDDQSRVGVPDRSAARQMRSILTEVQDEPGLE